MKTNDMLPLHTKRLILRRFTEADAAPFAAYRSDPDVARLQGWESCGLEEALRFVREHAERQIGIPGQWIQIAVALKETNELLGDCGLCVLEHEPRQATVGITFAREHQGRGFAAEALACLLDGVFAHLNLHRVVADTDPENVPAWTLLERLGLRREGHLKQSLWFKGRWTDEYLYAVLREEWAAARGRGEFETPVE